MSEAPQTEALERTLAELEVQQSAAQDAIQDTLSELELLYAELEERAHQLAGQAGPPPEGPDQQPEGEHAELLASLQRELDEVLRQRDDLQQRLNQAQADLDTALAVAEGADARHERSSSDTLTAPAAVGEESPVRQPFTQLRRSRQAGN